MNPKILKIEPISLTSSECYTPSYYPGPGIYRLTCTDSFGNPSFSKLGGELDFEVLAVVAAGHGQVYMVPAETFNSLPDAPAEERESFMLNARDLATPPGGYVTESSLEKILSIVCAYPRVIVAGEPARV